MVKIGISLKKLSGGAADRIISTLYRANALGSAEKSSIKRNSTFDTDVGDGTAAQLGAEHTLSISAECEDVDQADLVIEDVLTALKIVGPMEVTIKTSTEQVRTLGRESGLEGVTLRSGDHSVTMRPLDFLMSDAGDAVAAELATASQAG